jgi:hypothetical protein
MTTIHIDRCAQLTITLKHEFLINHIEWIRDISNNHYKFFLKYRHRIGFCQNLKQIRSLMEQGRHELITKYHEKQHGSDLLPIFDIPIGQIIKNDMYLVYTENEIDYINTKLLERSNKAIQLLVDNIYTNLLL